MLKALDSILCNEEEKKVEGGGRGWEKKKNKSYEVKIDFFSRPNSVLDMVQHVLHTSISL